MFTEIAQVMSPYSSKGPEQLNLSPGQLILILGKNSSGWWLGELQVSVLQLSLTLHTHCLWWPLWTVGNNRAHLVSG